MSVCPNCGKEIAGDELFCTQCGWRLKRGFTVDERQKYIEELEAYVRQQKEGESDQKRRDAEQREADRALWLTGLREGTATIQAVAQEPPIILKPRENLRVVLPNISLLEPRSVTEGSALYGGPTVRVAKGVSLRMGGVKGRGESHEELREVDRGILTLTDRRLVFSGRKRALEIDFRKITSVDPIRDGIGIRREGRDRTQYLTGIDSKAIAVVWKVDGREYSEPLTGMVLKCLIEGAVRQRESSQTEKETEPVAKSQSVLSQIKELAELRDAGIVTSEEFEAKKAELLKRL